VVCMHSCMSACSVDEAKRDEKTVKNEKQNFRETNDSQARVSDGATQNRVRCHRNDSNGQAAAVVPQRERASKTKASERARANQTGEQRVSMMRVNDSYLLLSQA
jgi:hypothetical protein